MSIDSQDNRRKEFYKIYTEQILPNIKNIEDEKIKLYNKYKNIGLILLFSSVAIAIFIYILLKLFTSGSEHFVFITALALYACFSFLQEPFSEYIFVALVSLFYIFFIVNATLSIHFKIVMGNNNLMYITSILVCIATYQLLRKVYKRKEMEKLKSINRQLKYKFHNELSALFGINKWKRSNTSVLSYDAELLKISEIDESGLFVTNNARYTDDEFSGFYNNVYFTVSETKLLNINPKNTTGSYRTRETIAIFPYCIFKGVIISMSFNKKIKNRTIVSTKWDLTSKNQFFFMYLPLIIICILLNLLFPKPNLDSAVEIFQYGVVQFAFVSFFILIWLAYKEKLQKESNPLNKIELEDPKFGKRFNVYSSDQIEARYLVTPAFMERLNNLKTAFGEKNIKCSFFSDKLMIAIPTKKDLFEICKIDKPTQEGIYEFYNELKSIHDIIDYFKLYEKLYPTK